MVCRFLACIIVTHANMVSCERSSKSHNSPSALFTTLSYQLYQKV